MAYLVLAGMFIFSIADLKYRVIPAVEVVFFGVVILTVQDHNVWPVAAVVAAVIFGVLPRVPRLLGYVLLFFPSAWPTLLFGYGVRRAIIGKADLYVIGIVSLLFSQDIVIAALVGVFLWIKWWSRSWKPRPIPLVPGMSLGVLVALGTRWVIAFAGGG